MENFRRLIAIQFILLFSVKTINCAADEDKIDWDVWKAMQAGENQDVIIECANTIREKREAENALAELSNFVETSPDDTRSGDNMRLTELFDNLQTISTLPMTPVLKLLKLVGADYDILWIAQFIFIRRAWPQLILDIAGISIVIRIRKEEIIPLIPPPPPPKPDPQIEGNKTWNIGLINARCRDIKCLGLGVRVGVIDTGARWDHVELKKNWVGKRFGWMDGCNKTTSPFPFDHDGHGTHVTGTIVGVNVGVAPEAKWMVCRTGDTALFDSAILLCSQFLACPYLWDDYSDEKKTKNCSARAHIINNSWGSAGGSQTFDPSNHKFYVMIKMWIGMGIIPVFSNANDGPSCGSGASPGNFDIVMSVGAVDNETTIAMFSSRGPTTMTKPTDNYTISDFKCFLPPPSDKCIANEIKDDPVCVFTKPDIVAPGVLINSAWNTNTTDYLELSGTSMASPHICGVIALMICAAPKKKWNYKMSYEILTSTTSTDILDLKGERKKTPGNKNQYYVKSSNILCNFLGADICTKPYPNNVFGYGLVNACKAVRKVLGITKTNLVRLSKVDEKTTAHQDAEHCQ